MPSITLETPSAGQEVTAGLHAANYADLQTLLNGGLDATNLAANAVGTSQIANDAVTADKLAESSLYSGHFHSATQIPSNATGFTFATYVPVWGSDGTQPAIGNGTITGRYCQLGKLVLVWVEMLLGSTSTIGTSTYNWTMPADFQTGVTYTPFGNATLLDASTSTLHSGTVVAVSTGTLVTVYNESSARWSASVPVVPASGDRYQIQAIFEAS